MTDIPFGFALPGAEPPDPNDPAAMQRFVSQLQQVLAGGGSGPVNWELARQIAVDQLTGSGPMSQMGFGNPLSGFGAGPMGGLPDGAGPFAGIDPHTGQPGPADDTEPPAEPVGDPSVTAAERGAVEAALRMADHWLEQVSTLPSGVLVATAWSRSEWISQTLPIWRKLCDPVAGRMVSAMSDLVPEEARAQFSAVQSVVTSIGGALFGSQLGSALGSLAAEVLSAGEIGLPLGPAGTAALVPANITAYGAGLELPEDEVRLYVALREAAHQRLFGNVPWLRGHVLAAVEAYAAGIRVDREAIEEAMGRLDPSDPGSMRELQLEGIFTPEDSPQQRFALARLETTLALVEGWVSTVVDSAVGDRLPNVPRLGEAFRRRRAAGGPAEQTFSALVGLELRPRRLREAAALWAAVTEHRGVAGRDALWGHPDLLPGADDFADPDAFARADTDFGDLSDFDTTELDASTEGSDNTLSDIQDIPPKPNETPPEEQ